MSSGSGPESWLLSRDNPVFQAFLGYAALVLAKTLIMSILTARQRRGKKVFPVEEDARWFKTDPKKAVVFNDPDVERVRRAHQNDLENILPFVLLGMLYVTTGPTMTFALIHFRVFAAARILHTLVYLGKVGQPARGACFMVANLVNVSMLVQILLQARF